MVNLTETQNIKHSKFVSFRSNSYAPCDLDIYTNKITSNSDIPTNVNQNTEAAVNKIYNYCSSAINNLQIEDNYY